MGRRAQLTTQSDRPPIRPSDFFLGADAGGSHTTVVIGTAGLTILGRADGPPAAMKPGGAPASAAVLSETGRRAAFRGSVDLPVERAVVAAAGAGRPQERADLEAALVQAGLARRVRVMADGQVAPLAPHVINAAGDGEAVAQRAVEEAARELVALVLTLERHYPGTGPVSVATAGGLLVAQAPLAEAFRTRLAAESNRARLVTT